MEQSNNIEQTLHLNDLKVHVDGELVTVKVHIKDNLGIVAAELHMMGHDMSPTIQVDGEWISGREIVDLTKDYHFCKCVCMYFIQSYTRVELHLSYIQ